MAVISNLAGGIFRQKPYEREDVFEADVVKLADQIFGPGSIYVDVKRRLGNDSIRTAPHLLQRLEGACRKSSSPNIDHYLDRSVYSGFRALVVIDEARSELHRVLAKISGNISVLELKRFEAEKGETLFQFDTLYDEFEEPEGSLVPDSDTLNPEERAKRRLRRASADTIVVPAREEGFQKVFLGENQWHAIRIGAAMKDRIKYIAAYQVAPIGAVTHIAELQDIKPYRDSGKYLVIFKAPAQKVGPIPLGASKAGPQGPVYVQREKLLKAGTLKDALSP